MTIGYKPQMMQFTDSFLKMYPEKINPDIAGTISKYVTFVLTEECNFRCTYCYQHSKNSFGVMSKETAQKAVDTLFEEYVNDYYIGADNAQCIILEMIGGEPFLEVDLMDYIVEYFKFKAVTLNHPWQLNYMISISTNGSLYNTPQVQEFLKRHEGRVSVTITIDGNKELHDSCRFSKEGVGTYDIVEAAIKKQVGQNKFSVGTKLTLAPGNIAHLDSAIRNLISLGLVDVFANVVYEKGWDLSHAKIMYEQLKSLGDYIIDNDIYTHFNTSLFLESIGQQMSESDNDNWCGGTGSMLAVSADGKLYPCLRYLPFCLKPDSEPMDIGDVENGIGYTQDQRDRIECMKCITRRSQSTDECFNCSIASGCSWCSAYNYEEFGTINKRATFICVMHKARVLANAYYWNNLYRKLNIEERFKLNIPKEWALEIIDIDEYEALLRLERSDV